MRFFLSKTKKSLSENDQSLIRNASYGDLEEVRDLLRAGANVNAQRDDGTTALYIASQVGSANVVRELLQNDKVDVNLQRSDGSTALYIASKRTMRRLSACCSKTTRWMRISNVPMVQQPIEWLVPRATLLLQVF
ncbi:hypothetical protein MHU86_20561 [Fragilaria crotonensis]|nr:hypothetical protein MHU86_20561 [Fragilaria crotonensis]